MSKESVYNVLSRMTYSIAKLLYKKYKSIIYKIPNHESLTSLDIVEIIQSHFNTKYTENAISTKALMDTTVMLMRLSGNKTDLTSYLEGYSSMELNVIEMYNMKALFTLSDKVHEIYIKYRLNNPDKEIKYYVNELTDDVVFNVNGSMYSVGELKEITNTDSVYSKGEGH